MRLITKEARDAFLANREFNKANTRVSNGVMYLHGNAILRRDETGAIEFTLAGWNTNTTRERLSPFVRIASRKSAPYINGVKISDNKWYKLTDFIVIVQDKTH